MAARGSFQKRQKEAQRREKRQLKLDRRQGRQPPSGQGISDADNTTETEEDSSLTGEGPEIAPLAPETVSDPV